MHDVYGMLHLIHGLSWGWTEGPSQSRLRILVGIPNCAMRSLFLGEQCPLSVCRRAVHLRVCVLLLSTQFTIITMANNHVMVRLCWILLLILPLILAQSQPPSGGGRGRG